MLVSAKFCPRCGREISSSDRAVHGVVPARAPLPLAGRLVLGVFVLAAILIGAGIYLHLPLLWITGTVIAVVLVALFIIGSHVS